MIQSRNNGMMAIYGLLISLIILWIFSFTFLVVYADTQYEYHNVWIDLGWWLDRVAPPIAIIIAVIIFILEQRSENTRRREDYIQEIVRSCNSILRELDDHNKAFYGGIHSQTVNKDDGISYTNAYLNTDAFTSISRSGLFTRFNSETQNQLSNLYTRIIKFNSESVYKFRFQDMYRISFKTQDSKRIYEERMKNINLYLTSLETEIKDYLPVVRSMIEDEKIRPR